MFGYALLMSTVVGVRTGDQLRARRRRKLADEIELTALRLFAERGIDAVTIDDIAAATDISRRTFFRYFGSKDDLLHGSPQRYVDAVRATIDAAPHDSTTAVLVRRILLALADEHTSHHEALELRTRIAADTPAAFAKSPSLATLVETIVDAVASHTGCDAHTDLALRTYIHAGFGAAQAAVRTWLTTTNDRSLHDLTAEALDLIHLH